MMGIICILFFMMTIPFSLSAPEPFDTLTINLNLTEGTNTANGKHLYKHIGKYNRYGAKDYGYVKYGYRRYAAKGKCDSKWLNKYQGYRPADKPQSDYIIGGTLVNDWKEWPWIARLRISVGERNKLCGGVLISCQHVITALHCLLDKSTNKTVPAGNIVIYLGTIDENGEGGAKFTGAELFLKKDQNGNIEFIPNRPKHPIHDIAVIKLDRSINPYTRENKHIRPIMLPTRALEKNDEYWFAGWGAIGFDEWPETLMQTSKIKIGDAIDCKMLKYFNATNNICMILTSNDSTGSGDSGSPGMIADGKSRWYLEGIDSRIINIKEDGEEKRVGVQMNVMYYRKDIEGWIAK